MKNSILYFPLQFRILLCLCLPLLVTGTKHLPLNDVAINELITTGFRQLAVMRPFLILEVIQFDCKFLDGRDHIMHFLGGAAGEVLMGTGFLT